MIAVHETDWNTDPKVKIYLTYSDQNSDGSSFTQYG